uniref:hypothetical protein n=1 Tax=Candidatus Fimenecus sp. TaxID=3022888 RepID=UPI003FEF0CB7
MAKKEKVTLTPEEIEAKKARKKEKRIIFGKTFERAIVWLLAVVLVYSVTYISLNNKGVAAVSATPAQSGSQNAGGSASKSDWDTSANGSGSSQSGSQGSTSGDNASGGNAAAAEAGVDAAVAAEAINAATAKAVAAGYHWTRSAQYTQPIDVGNATGALNKIIQGIDSEASLDSVVGGFLGIGDKEMDIEKGGSAAEQIEYHGENYALQATALQAGDLKNLKVDGNTYTFEIENASSPQHDKSTAMSRFTNDFLTQDEISSEIKGFISAASVNSAAIEYSNIKATVVIEDGTLKEFKYSYDGNVAELNIKVAIVSVNGKGAMHVDAAYTGFAY